MLRRAFLASSLAVPLAAQPPRRRTTVSIDQDRFLINGTVTYPGRTFEG